MLSDLSLKATRGVLWSLAENLGLQGMQFVVSILLARLLLPEQFGLIGMLTLFMGLAQSLLDSGFGSALIQKKDADQVDYCSVFYFNLVIGVLLTGLLWLAAPHIAVFYEQPLLTPLTRFLSLNILISAFRLVPFVMLSKRLQFKAMFQISLASVAVSGGVGVTMAFMGFGVWSLVVQSVMEAAVRMILVWIASRWQPGMVFSGNSLRAMFSFGSRMLLSGLLDTFFTNIYQVFIGKVYSPADLGYYVRAQSLQAVAVQPTGMALGRVIFPALAPIQDDRPRLKQAFKKIMTTAVFFHFPLMIGLIVVARPLITLLLTDRWSFSIPYFQLFCLVGLMWPLHVLNLNILTITGRSDTFLRLEIAKKALVVLALVITFRLGIVALLYGQIAVSIAGYLLNSYYCGKIINYSTPQQIRDFASPLLVSIGMGFAMFLVGEMVALEFQRLLLQFCIGVLTYLGANLLLGSSVFIEFLNLIKTVIKVPNTV